VEKQITIAEWNLQIDMQATTLAYHLIHESCTCGYCRNFRAAHTALPSELLRLLESLGIDSANPVHISEICQNPDGTHLYSVFYEVVGRIISGPDFRLDVQSNNRRPVAVELFPETQIVVTGEPYAPGHFPDPAVEIEFFVNLPWVIDERP
jgi:hypothetical protein